MENDSSGWQIGQVERLKDILDGKCSNKCSNGIEIKWSSMVLSPIESRTLSAG